MSPGGRPTYSELVDQICVGLADIADAIELIQPDIIGHPQWRTEARNMRSLSQSRPADHDGLPQPPHNPTTNRDGPVIEPLTNRTLADGVSR